MRKTTAMLMLATGLVLGTTASAHDFHGPMGHCSVSTDYDLAISDSGIAFSREAGAPTRVFMHDGALRVDGHDLAVSAADAERLRSYERTVRALVPEVAAIAREGLDIGYSALTTVATTFAEDGDARSRLLDRLNRDHARALTQLDAGIGHGMWKRDAMQDSISDGIENAVSELVSTVTANAVKAALSGDQNRMAALQARADSLDATIQHQVDARADALEARAQALCPKLGELERLQSQFGFRLPDGSPLHLLAPEHAGHDDDKDKLAAR